MSLLCLLRDQVLFHSVHHRVSTVAQKNTHQTLSWGRAYRYLAATTGEGETRGVQLVAICNFTTRCYLQYSNKNKQLSKCPFNKNIFPPHHFKQSKADGQTLKKPFETKMSQDKSQAFNFHSLKSFILCQVKVQVITTVTQVNSCPKSTLNASRNNLCCTISQWRNNHCYEITMMRT